MRMNSHAKVTIITGLLCLVAMLLAYAASADDGGKTTLCHFPPEPQNPHTVTVPDSAVSSHLAHGDYLGPCVEDDCDAGPDCDEPECDEDLDCSNALFCDGLETCVDGVCLPGTLPCTEEEICSEELLTCEQPPECETDDQCNNGIFCDGLETCVEGTCVLGIRPCPFYASCDENRHCYILVQCIEDADCNNEEFCDGTERCVNFRCVEGEPPCEDGETCVEESDTCLVDITDAGPEDDAGNTETPRGEPEPEEEEEVYLSGSSAFTAMGCSSTGGVSLFGLFAFLALFAFRRKSLPLIAALLMLAPAAYAEGTNHFQVAPGPNNYLVTEHPSTLGHLETSGWLVLDYANNPLVLRNADGEVVQSVVNHQANLQLAASLGLLDIFEFGLNIPAAYLHGPGLNGDALHGIAAGDPRLTGKWKLIDKTFSLALHLEGDLPLALVNQSSSAATLMGDPYPTLTPGLSAGLDFDWLRFAANIGHTFRYPKVMGPDTVGSTLNYSAGAEVDLIPDIWSLTGDLYGNLGYPSPVLGDLFSNRFSSPLEGLVGTKVTIGPVALTAGVGTGLIYDYGSPDFRAFVGVGWVPVPEEPVKEKVCEPCECEQCPLPVPLPVPVEEPKKKVKETTKVEDTLVVLLPDRIEILDPIHFEFDSDIIKEDSFVILDNVAKVIKDNPDITLVSVEGHTDSVGSVKYNQDLSERRSASVKAYLINVGVEEERLTTKGFGELKPLVENNTSARRATNRRVEFIIVERAVTVHKTVEEVTE